MNILQKHVDLLGQHARDKVTGFVGVVDSISFDLYGCVQAVVRPPAKDGEVKDGRWFDVHRLVILDKPRAMPVPSFPQLASADGTHTKGPAEKSAR